MRPLDNAALVNNPRVEIWRKKLQYLLHNILARIFVALLILADIVVVIIQLATAETVIELDIVSLVFSCIFMIETGMRIFAKGAVRYFTRWFCVFEFVVIVTTFALSIATIALYNECVASVNEEECSNSSSAVEVVRLITSILRVFRILKMLRVFRFVTEWVNLLRSTRYTTSQNKRRYIADGFDLDLCYITNQIIAMSFPSSGIAALYRNPINKVAQFLNTKHPEKYLVINMCSEKGYDPLAFNGNARRFHVDDHYPPFFTGLVEVVNVMRDWLGRSNEHVVAVHCRGGKGRTGTVICAYLLSTGNFENTTETLDYFAGQRTDLEVGSKYQGVETPSQGRYLKYFEHYLANHEQLPPIRQIKITQFRINNLLKVSRNVLNELTFRIYQKRQEVFYGDVFFKIGCEITIDEESDVITLTLDNPPTVSEDVKIVFFCKSLPTHYWRSAFYFLFHTGFLPEGSEGSLVLTRAELDNPHKLAKFYGDTFSVETVYSNT